MRLIDADEVMKEINKNKLLSREPATKRCMKIIKNSTTYTEPPMKHANWVEDRYGIMLVQIVVMNGIRRNIMKPNIVLNVGQKCKSIKI